MKDKKIEYPLNTFSETTQKEIKEYAKNANCKLVKRIVGEIEKHYNLGREELIKIVKAKHER